MVKLDPTVKYQRMFDRKLKTLANKIGPIGTDCFKKYGIPTANRLFTEHLDDCVKKIAAHARMLEQQAKINCKVVATHRKYNNLYRHKDDISPEEFRVHARDISNTIHDLPARWTGFRTQASLDADQKTREHFHPRQWSGTVIMSYIYLNNGITHETLREFFEVFRQVHHTTDIENRKLMPFQDPGSYVGWESAYEKACSELVQIHDKGPILKVKDIWDVTMVEF